MQISLELDRLDHSGQPLQSHLTHPLEQFCGSQPAHDDVTVSLELFDFGGSE